MTQVVSFVGYTPIARYDALPWTKVRVEEGTTAAGPWTQIDEITLSPVDADPSDPAARNVTTALASDPPSLWYRLIFVDAALDTEAPSDPVQNSVSATPYASVDELARILKIRTPSTEQTVAMNRVLAAAALEINREIDLADDADPLTGAELDLVTEVNLERAVELWRLEETAFGIVGLGSEFGASHIARNTWDKYAFTLAPLKDQWGLA